MDEFECRSYRQSWNFQHSLSVESIPFYIALFSRTSIVKRLAPRSYGQWYELLRMRGVTRSVLLKACKSRLVILYKEESQGPTSIGISSEDPKMYFNIAILKQHRINKLPGNCLIRIVSWCLRIYPRLRTSVFRMEWETYKFVHVNSYFPFRALGSESWLNILTRHVALKWWFSFYF